MIRSIKFDEFELDGDRYQLRRAGKGLKLEKMPMDLLILPGDEKRPPRRPVGDCVVPLGQ